MITKEELFQWADDKLYDMIAELDASDLEVPVKAIYYVGYLKAMQDLRDAYFQDVWVAKYGEIEAGNET